ncbi:MAG: hypothetical protein HY059_18390 [Proteobacteria bacterium]|nr:hypothetical protein [Pseudomonadota bacterium]
MSIRTAVLALAFAAAAVPAFAQTPGAIVMPAIAPAIVNTAQPPPVVLPPPPDAAKTADDAQKPKTN